MRITCNNNNKIKVILDSINNLEKIEVLGKLE